MAERTSVGSIALTNFTRSVLTNAGMREDNANIVAEALVYADLRGVGSHGVARLSTYLSRVEHGVMELDPDMVMSRESVSSGVLDARNGFGQVAGTIAMRQAVNKAAETGVAAISVAHSNHFGVAGYFAERAAQADAIGIVLTNASPAMSPHNTSVPLLGTNPIAFGVPSGEHPVVLDMSSSLVARGKIRRAAANGLPIPMGWAVDAAGQPTTDAAAALRGTLAPIGGAKGAGLSLVIDLLCGVLSETSLTGEVTNITDTGRPSKTSHLVIALAIKHFTDVARFVNDVTTVGRTIRELPAADGENVYLPGDIEYDNAMSATESGISLPEDVWYDLVKVGKHYDVPPPDLHRSVPASHDA
ncbi:Ldh family oxidoreductase [Micromonospora sp. NPDC005206]|uniref:Ldh family oxidoreductase n=1 Tax=Micromonospora sp. NPDC005206 TaxID=3157022 RepID=UPI00339F8E80